MRKNPLGWREHFRKILAWKTWTDPKQQKQIREKSDLFFLILQNPDNQGSGKSGFPVFAKEKLLSSTRGKAASFPPLHSPQKERFLFAAEVFRDALEWIGVAAIGKQDLSWMNFCDRNERKD